MVASSLMSSTKSVALRMTKVQNKLLCCASSMSFEAATSAASAGRGGGFTYATLSMTIGAMVATTAATITGTPTFEDSLCTQCERPSRPTNSSFEDRQANSSRAKLPILKTRMTSVGRFSILSETVENPR